jgi:hypothetical protein
MGFGNFFSSTSGSKVKQNPNAVFGQTWLKNLLEQSAPTMPTLETAGMSSAEQQGQGFLQQYLNGSSNQGDYNLALDELRKTLSGDYDPLTGAQYQGYRDASQMEEESAANKVAGRASATGTYGFSGALTGEGMVRRGFTADRQNYLGGLKNQERNRQLSAAGMLPETSDYASAEPLRKTAAASTYGALPREIEQNENLAKYNQIMQAIMFPYTTQANIAQVLATLQPIGSTSYKEPSDFDKTGSIAEIISSIVGPKGVTK